MLAKEIEVERDKQKDKKTDLHTDRKLARENI